MSGSSRVSDTLGQRAELRGLRRQVEPARRGRVPRLARRPAGRPVARRRRPAPARSPRRCSSAAAPAEVVGVEPSDAFREYAAAPGARPAGVLPRRRARRPSRWTTARSTSSSRGWSSTSSPTDRRRWPRCAAPTRPGGTRRRLRLGLPRRDAADDALLGGRRGPRPGGRSRSTRPRGSTSAGPTRCARLFADAGLARRRRRGDRRPDRLRATSTTTGRRSWAAPGRRPAYAMSLSEARPRRAAGRRPGAACPIADDGSIHLTARAWAVRGRGGGFPRAPERRYSPGMASTVVFDLDKVLLGGDASTLFLHGRLRQAPRRLLLAAARRAAAGPRRR